MEFSTTISGRGKSIYTIVTFKKDLPNNELNRMANALRIDLGVCTRVEGNSIMLNGDWGTHNYILQKTMA